MAARIDNEQQGHIRLKLKWPNDIHAVSYKVGGVLCESRYSGNKGFYVIIGVGLNVQNEKPTMSLSQLAKDAGIDSTYLTREVVLAEFLKQFQDLMSSFSEVKRLLIKMCIGNAYSPSPFPFSLKSHSQR